MSQTKQKCYSLVLGRSGLWIVWRCHDTPRVHCCYFCLEPSVRKDAWMRTTFVAVMIFFSKVAFWKLLDHSPVQSSFPIITRHIENSNLKDILQFNVFRTWINLSATSFIKTLVNMKQKSMTVPRKRSVAQKSKGALRKTLNLSRPRFTYFTRFFFLSNLVFKFNIVLIGNFWIILTTNLFTFLAFV